MIIASISAVLALSAQADDKLFVLSPAAIAPDATAFENIKRECIDGMTVELPSYSQNAPPTVPVSPPVAPGVAAQAAWFLSKKVIVEEIADLAKAGNARVLRLTIVEIEGRTGGVHTYGGRKGMTVKAELLQNGKVLKSDDFTRRSTVTPYTGDACLVLARVASTIGKDVADWVTRPPRMQAAPVSAPPRTAAEKAPSPAPATAAAPASRAAPADSPSARRLTELQLLLDRGLITPDEYQEKRKAILKDL